MLRTVKDACQLHPMALDYVMGEQIENLSDVIERTAADAQEFFDKNFITKGMEILLSQGLKRLAGRSEQAVFELKQAMGGGKTHSMIALGLLARDGALRDAIVREISNSHFGLRRASGLPIIYDLAKDMVKNNFPDWLSRSILATE